MTPRPGLDTRLERLEDRQHREITQTIVRTIAEGEGISASELSAELERMTAICQGQDITSGPAMVRYWADDLGITLEELEQRVDRYRELVP